MKISEPMTMLTDYILGLFTIYLAIRLLEKSNNQISIVVFALAFIFTAIGAIIGGSSHGFKRYFSDSKDRILWKSTLYTIGIGSLLMLVGAIVSSVSHILVVYILCSLAGVKFLVYAWWMMSHDDFIYVIMDYIPSMVIVIVLKTIALYRYDDPSSIWIIVGIGVAFIAAGIQALGKGLHKHFNHNDIFHVIQLPAMYLIYRGTLLFEDLI